MAALTGFTPIQAAVRELWFVDDCEVLANEALMAWRPEASSRSRVWSARWSSLDPPGVPRPRFDVLATPKNTATLLHNRYGEVGVSAAVDADTVRIVKPDRVGDLADVE